MKETILIMYRVIWMKIKNRQLNWNKLTLGQKIKENPDDVSQWKILTVNLGIILKFNLIVVQFFKCFEGYQCADMSKLIKLIKIQATTSFPKIWIEVPKALKILCL